jgi:hypothetical protein
MNKIIQSDKFWYDDGFVIIQRNRLTEFFPTRDQTLEERLNALVRLSLYCSIVLYYYHRNYKYFSIFLGALLLTYYIYVNKPSVEIKSDIVQSKNVESESFSNKNVESESFSNKNVESFSNNNNDQIKCTAPTLDNPFMNVTMKDYMNSDPVTQKTIDRPVACDTTDENVKQTIDDFFNHNLFKDVNDVFGKMNSQRQFYTMPSTTIPNAQDEFAKWLYANPKTCKEDQEFCLRYEDVRAKRPVFVDPTQNPENSKKLQES